MIAVLKRSATAEQINLLIQQLEALGLTVHISEGKESTVERSTVMKKLLAMRRVSDLLSRSPMIYLISKAMKQSLVNLSAAIKNRGKRPSPKFLELTYAVKKLLI